MENTENKVEQPNMEEFVEGELTPTEIQQLSQLRESANLLIREIGEAELRKAKLMGSFQACEDRANLVLEGVKERLGIAEGQAWQVSPDNKVRIIPAPAPVIAGDPDDSGMGRTNG